MQQTYECDYCEATLEVGHKYGFGQRDLHTDRAYCEDCVICYEADRKTAMFKISNPAATALYARLNALDVTPYRAVKEAFDKDVAWGEPLRTTQDADTIRQLIQATRTTAVKTSFKRGGNSQTRMPVQTVRLTFKTDCPLCHQTHVGQIEDGGFTETGGFKGDTTFRCRCGRSLTADQNGWTCDDCGRAYEWSEVRNE